MIKRQLRMNIEDAYAEWKYHTGHHDSAMDYVVSLVGGDSFWMIPALAKMDAFSQLDLLINGYYASPQFLQDEIDERTLEVIKDEVNSYFASPQFLQDEIDEKALEAIKDEVNRIIT